MHSSCRIPEVQHLFVRARDNTGLGELAKDPAWKTRRTNQVCGRRLVKQLATLNQRCDESTNRINHDIRQIRSLLISNRTCLLQTSAPVDLFSSPVCSAAADGREGSGRARHVWPSVDSDPSRKRYVPGTGCKQSNVCWENFLYFPPTVTHHGSKSGRMLGIGDAKTGSGATERLIFSARPCGYGDSPKERPCYHFPCKRLKTYNSFGFRPFNLPTRPKAQQRSSALPSLQDLVSPATSRRLAGEMQVASVRSSESYRRRDSLKHRLPSAVKLRPVDTAFREQLLREETERRRRLHHKTRPANWATNYGQPTPFKHLWYPVRLRPSELLSY
ncbi:hypothetical protein PoB_006185900 [Plakobranchus ocellatus]|uniref:Uncharacterized protein n=1 Tax=Plakobranchus ocellatus TaxID=259542 RepID=A0AAV4CU00_9GAST|nr:hypothetical protein PoB_006185900 [Plakobranchus ocellatus]